MPREKKDFVRFSIKMATDVNEKLVDFCNETGISKTAAVERFLEKGLDEYFARPEEERNLY